MSERKVINKYYAPDFDPAKIPKVRRPGKGGQKKVRMMLPMSVRCLACGNYIYKGTKFNSRKETVKGEDYLGIPIFRFYIRCSRCSSEFTIKTDPKNADYVCEKGASSNFDGLKEERRRAEAEKLRKSMEEEENAMKKLENKSYDSKREMELLEEMDNIQIRRSKKEMLDPNDLLSITLEKTKRDKRKRDGELDDFGLTEDDLDELKEAELLFKKKESSQQTIGDPSLFVNKNNGESIKKNTSTTPKSSLPFKIRKV